MSRFFSVVSSESESGSESSGDEGEQGIQPRAAALRALNLSDDDDDIKRVVRSEKDKRYDELKDIIKKMKNFKRIKDMSNLLSDFENLTRAYDKAKKVVEKEGMPRFYLRCLVELEDFVIECWEDREGRKTMSKNNSKGLTNLRQKLKKYLRNFEAEVKNYRENPDAEEEEKSDGSDDDMSDSDSDDGSVDIPFLKKQEPASTKKPKFLRGESDSDREYNSWEEEDQEGEESSSDEEEHLPKFLKGLEDQPKEKSSEVGKKRKKKEERRRREAEEEDGEGEWEEVKGGVPMPMTEKPKMFPKDADITHEAVIKKLFEVIAARGKKGTDRTEQIELLIELEAISQAHNLGPAISCKVLFHIIAAIFDYNPNIATCMKPELWNRCLEYLTLTLTKLEENRDITIGENITDDSEQLEESPYRVRGCILTMLERMDEEYIKMLQACDAHSTDYVERLKDEQGVCNVIKRVQAYIEKGGHSNEICRIYQRRVEHVYYKFDHVNATMKKNKETNESVKIPENYEDSAKVMEKLCKYIYTHDTTDRIRTRAILCHIYHHALHDRWFEARDLMLMSHLQDTIHHSDVPTQIMYNRAMVQLGLCAFRQGMVKDAHNALVDIQSGGRAKELLAQGLLLQRQHERTPEQEKIEKRRQMPYHMHINLELLECVYLVSAMLMEIPYMAAHELDSRRRMISKNFHHVLRLSERQPLVGPPESMREHVVAASKSMKTGDWRACKNYIINEKMNAKVWDLFFQATRVRDMITQKIQEESLRTYLFTYSSVYDSISLLTLAEMFELEKGTVHSIISKMIINEELMASLDQPTQSVVMHRTEPTRLQALALQLSEKVSSLVENNERIVEMKQGNFFYQKQGGKDFNYQNKGGYDRNKGGNYDRNKEGGYRGGRGGYRGNRGGGGGYRGDRDGGGYRGNKEGGYQGRRDNNQGRNQFNRDQGWGNKSYEGRNQYNRDNQGSWGNKSYEGNRGGGRQQRNY